MSTQQQTNGEAIAVIDLGGQYCHMISRRLRDLGVRTDILDPGTSKRDVEKYAGIILSGGPRSVYEPGAPKIDKHILDAKRPILGICYGHQLLAQYLGAKVEAGKAEYGKTTLKKLRNAGSLFKDTPSLQTVWMSHADTVRELDHRLVPLAQTDSCEVAAFRDPSQRIFGVQFHPEVAHTAFGTHILENFTRRICRVHRHEHVKDRVARLITEIRDRVGNRSVFFFVSGGVDSTVAFTLCARALPRDKILGIYVDTGFMRKNETKELKSLLKTAGLSDRLKIRDESERFLNALKTAVDPEEKRKIIGRLFVEVQQAAMREYGIDSKDWLLGQGTIYPDTIESGGTSAAALIKTHHNRCDEIRQMMAAGKVIEPLAEFYKDEVRLIGAQLRIDKRLVNRWPFPGPGLAIRCLCSDKKRQNVIPRSLPDKFSDYEAVQIPNRSVGVQGDGRTYRQVLALKGPLNYARLATLSSLVCNTGQDINRVIAHVAGSVELTKGYVEPATITRSRIKRLRDADYVVRTIMQRYDLTHRVWQFPVVLTSVSFDGGESVILRPVNSQDGMTANFARLPVNVLRQIGTEVIKIRGVDAVFLDVTDKPPATIEWE